MKKLLFLCLFLLPNLSMASTSAPEDLLNDILVSNKDLKLYFQKTNTADYNPVPADYVGTRAFEIDNVLSFDTPYLVAAFGDNNLPLAAAKVVKKDGQLYFETDGVSVGISGDLDSEDVIKVMFLLSKPKMKSNSINVALFRFKSANTFANFSGTDTNFVANFEAKTGKKVNFKTSELLDQQCNCCLHNFCDGDGSKCSKKKCNLFQGSCHGDCNYSCKAPPDCR